MYQKSMCNITLSNLIAVITSYNNCHGILSTEIIKQSSLKKHSVSKIFSPTSSAVTLHESEFYRPSNCLLLFKNTDDTQCNICSSTEHKLQKQDEKATKRKEIAEATPAKLNAPISTTSSKRLKLTMQSYRLENKMLKNEIEKLQQGISLKSKSVSADLSNDLVSIVNNSNTTMPPFMKLFWEEQQKYVKSSPNSIRYHPMIIRYCLSLAAKSSSMYDDIRYDEKNGTGFLILPSRRRLRDYKNYIRPQHGFNPEIIDELAQKTKSFSEIEKFIVLLFDEMKVQDSLVWDKHTGDLIGYVDLGDADINFATLEKTDEVATHILVFMIRSIVNPFKFSLANFATTGATSSEMFPLFWQAVSICENNDLKVIAATGDGASQNRKMFKMHERTTLDADINHDVDVTYRTLNVFSTEEKRFIYFISDAPHLAKTARNSLYNSGSGLCTRYMWKGGMFLIWNHIADLFHEDRNCGLHLLPKLTPDHIRLTSFAKMNVRLAVQILSSTVSKVLSTYGPPEAAETATFCAMMDSFFDITNIRNTEECTRKRKAFLKPFSTTDDHRFSWLKNVFLKYFEDWLISIHDRPGQFTDNARAKMFIPHQTHTGIKITVNSLIEVITYLLTNNVPYVLTERFCQDPLENYFGRQRSMGSRKDNPTIRDFGYNDNGIRNQKVFRPISSGNSGNADRAMIDISDEPVPCRKRRSKQQW